MGESDGERPGWGTLLIVDDREDVRLALVRFMRRYFPSVFTAANGEEAAAVLEAAHPTHVICDYNLGPEQPTGAVLVGRWRARYPRIICAVLVSATDQALIGPVQGADAVFEKPPDLEELVAFLLSRDRSRMS